MSFHEKSALACLISIGVIYIPYFAAVLRFPMSALGLFWIAAAGLTLLLAVCNHESQGVCQGWRWQQLQRLVLR